MFGEKKEKNKKKKDGWGEGGDSKEKSEKSGRAGWKAMGMADGKGNWILSLPFQEPL